MAIRFICFFWINNIRVFDISVSNANAYITISTEFFNDFPQTLRTVTYDTLEGQTGSWLLGHPTRRLPVLSAVASRRPTVRRADANRP